MKEEWREIKGFEEYRISNYGRVLNKHGRLLKTYVDKDKFFDGEKIRLYNGDKRKVKMIKRLVAAAFIQDVKGKNVLIKNLQKKITPHNLVVLSKTRNGR